MTLICGSFLNCSIADRPTNGCMFFKKPLLGSAPLVSNGQSSYKSKNPKVILIMTEIRKKKFFLLLLAHNVLPRI